MFTEAEKQLIKDLKHKPISELARYFPHHTFDELSQVGTHSFDPEVLKAYPFAGLTYKRFLSINDFTVEDYAKLKKYGNEYLWDEFQEQYIIDMTRLGYSSDLISLGFRDKFGFVRTESAINSRLKQRGINNVYESRKTTN